MSERGRFGLFRAFFRGGASSPPENAAPPPGSGDFFRACLLSLVVVLGLTVAGGLLLRDQISSGFRGFARVQDVAVDEDAVMSPEKLEERRRERQLLTSFLLDPESLTSMSEEDRQRLVRAVNRLYRDFAAGPQIAAERALNRLALLRLSLTRLAGLEIALKARLEVGGDDQAILELRNAVDQTTLRISQHALAYVRDVEDLKERSTIAALSCGEVISVLSDRYATGNTGAEDGDAEILAPRPLNLDNDAQARLIEVLELHCIANNPPSEDLVVGAMCDLFSPDAIRPERCAAGGVRQARL